MKSPGIRGRVLKFFIFNTNQSLLLTEALRLASNDGFKSWLLLLVVKVSADLCLNHGMEHESGREILTEEWRRCVYQQPPWVSDQLSYI